MEGEIPCFLRLSMQEEGKYQRRSPKIIPHVDQWNKVTYEAAIMGYFEIDVKDGDSLDVGDVEDALRDYLSKFEWGGGHMPTLTGVG
jgi:hypothetical protein